jgi:hypothetical protein
VIRRDSLACLSVAIGLIIPATGAGATNAPHAPWARAVHGGASFAATQTLLYVAQETDIGVYTESGQSMGAFAQSTGANSLQMDDAGDVFVVNFNPPRFQTKIVRYAIGGKTPAATYAPKCPACGGGPYQVSHKGGLAYLYIQQNGTGALDIWDPGKTGKPSRTLLYPGLLANLVMDNNGTLYIPYRDPSSGSLRFDVVPAGASKPSRTIVDTLIPPSKAANFFYPYAMTALADGTLYVGEWLAEVGDPLAGLYVYPITGKQRFISNGAAAPVSTAVDALGKVYVLNDNLATFATGQYQCDTLHTLSVYSRQADALVSQAKSGFTNGLALTVAGGGTSFISEFPYRPSQRCTAPQGAGALAMVAPGAKTAKTLLSGRLYGAVSLYDGSIATNPGSQAEK